MFCTLTPKHAHLLPAVFFQLHLEQRWGMDVQTRPRPGTIYLLFRSRVYVPGLDQRGLDLGLDTNIDKEVVRRRI